MDRLRCRERGVCRGAGSAVSRGAVDAKQGTQNCAVTWLEISVTARPSLWRIDFHTLQ
jgi:hypothetical protein